MERVSGKVEALELTTDELLKRMSKEQPIIFMQGILRRMEESLDDHLEASALKSDWKKS